MNTKKFLISPNKKINLSKIRTDETLGISSKKDSVKLLKKNVEQMRELQAKVYAQDKYSLLIIFQAMDAAGKDGTIKHVMSGLNPQGTQVFSFKQPSKEELDHGYLWRINKALPERGRIGIFNRSHYEEVLVVRVHDLVKYQKIPDKFNNKKIWKQRYQQINDFEKYLNENGIVVIKFFLHVSKEEQKERFIKRIEDPAKNWKFSMGDIEERKYWDDYQKAYQESIAATSKKHAPWYVIPADKKWFMRLAVSEIVVKEMKKLKPEFPKLSKKQLSELEEARKKIIDDSALNERDT
ncbi:MAG: polyphosphate kinase 2 family protein [Ignavibacteria bacterium]|nr:polyphosphate kinase 2 family protein [Ignavibacteria bacterium]MBT8381583.1 polyphosphate kinase 2 family protein [Ignavibacteria bacterium]MBT8391974.1 polyphosphate kinase 2 family protein [Ignavibacteria bacterium]NNJ53166.1 polyphosphate kinase 2 family protein [Ignavibacteriaceae bacterium]NNL21035.1 polyphosphate kinase 2 family protein [Ignavibacteriaceae bacterium]